MHLASVRREASPLTRYIASRVSPPLFSIAAQPLLLAADESLHSCDRVPKKALGQTRRLRPLVQHVATDTACLKKTNHKIEKCIQIAGKCFDTGFEILGSYYLNWPMTILNFVM